MPHINFAWWNLQNFFDTDDDPISNDFSFTPAAGWTDGVFNKKKENLAEGLNLIWPNEKIDLLTVCEIEKDTLLQELLEEAGMDHLSVVFDAAGTSDLRGIDVAMAYNPSKLTVVSRTSHLVHLRYRTRDIFEVVFRINDTGEEFVVIASHWPSRSRGQYHSEPLRIAVAEHIAFLVEAHTKVDSTTYETLQANDDLAAIQAKWESKVLVVGDFNDEPFDRSIIQHLKASRDLDKVKGATNDFDKFVHTYKYRARETFLYNLSTTLLNKSASGNTGTYFLSGLFDGTIFTNRYQMLDQLVVTRGFLSGSGITAEIDTFDIVDDGTLATSSGRPRSFKYKSSKPNFVPSGYSDHLPLKLKLNY